MKHLRIDNCFKNTALMVPFLFPPQNMSLCCFRPLPWRTVIPGLKTRKICCLKGRSNLQTACLQESRPIVKSSVLVSAQESAATAGRCCLLYTWLRLELLPATPLKRNGNKLGSGHLQWCLWVCFVFNAGSYHETRMQTLSESVNTTAVRSATFFKFL